MFMNGVSYYRTSYANMESLALRILQVTQVRTQSLTSGYPGHAEYCPPYSVTKVQSHDEGKGGRSVSGIQGSVTGVQNKIVIEGMENEWARKCNGGTASRFTTMYGVALGVHENVITN